MADAQVTIGCDASAVEKAMGSALTSAKNFAKGVSEAVGYGLSSVASGLTEVALAQGKVSFASQHQQVREFEAATAHLAVAMNADLGQVRGSLEATGISIGKRPQEVAAWAQEVGRLTYDFDGATKSMKGMAELASLTGRSASDYKGLAAELGIVGRVSGDTSQAIGVLKAQADLLGTKGGVAAFADQVEALGDIISRFSMTSTADFQKVTALAGELGKGLSPQAAGRVQQSALGNIASDPMGWSRFLGRDVTDEHGQVKDPTKVLQQITEKIKRVYGKDARRMMQLEFGSETGAALFNADFKEVEKAAKVAPSTAPAEAQKAYLATDAGKREVAGAELSQASRDLMGSSSLLGKAADALQRFAAHSPVLTTAGATATSTLISTLLSGKVAGRLIGAGGEFAGGVSVGGASLGGLASKAGAVGAAVGSLYLAYDQITKTAKELGGWQSVGRDLKDWFGGSKPAVSKGLELRRPGESDDQFAQRLHAERAARDQARLDVHVKVESSQENPVTATVKTSGSAAAGSQVTY